MDLNLMKNVHGLWDQKLKLQLFTLEMLQMENNYLQDGILFIKSGLKDGNLILVQILLLRGHQDLKSEEEFQIHRWVVIHMEKLTNTTISSNLKIILNNMEKLGLMKHLTNLINAQLTPQISKEGHQQILFLVVSNLLIRRDGLILTHPQLFIKTNWLKTIFLKLMNSTLTE